MHIIQNIPIQFTLSESGIHVISNAELHQLMQLYPKSGAKELVRLSKSEFLKINQRAINITDRSLLVEIWGHYYFEKVFLKASWLFFPFPRLKKLLENSMLEFDCAEKHVDPNRFIWDFVSLFFPLYQWLIKDVKKNKILN